MNAALRPLAPIGRILLALIFVLAGIGKISTTAATASYMASHGIPLAHVLVYGVILVELGGGLMLMAGLYARWAAGVLFLYTLALAVIFHPYWAVPAADAQLQHAMFFEHLSMMGGMLFVVALGAGPLSVDAFRRRDAAAWEGELAHAGHQPFGRAR
jgi:putative oxidoreductase